MTSLQEQWRAAQQQRQQELAQRAAAVRHRLAQLQAVRAQVSQDIQQQLTQFREELALEVDLLQEQWSQEAGQRSQVEADRREAVNQQIQSYAQDRQEQAQALRQDLANFRDDLAQQHAAFLQGAYQADRTRHQGTQARRRRTLTQVKNLHTQRQRQAQSLRRTLAHDRQFLAQTHAQDTRQRRRIWASRSATVQKFLNQSQELRHLQGQAQQQELAEHRSALTQAVWGSQGILPKAAPAPRPSASRPSGRSSVAAPVARPAAPAPRPAAPKPSLTAPATPGPSPETQIYAYLKQNPGARLAEIEPAVGLNRIQVVDALRELTKQGKVTQQDRAYFIQEGTDS